MPDTRNWIALSAYESTDNVCRFYRCAHGADLTADWANTITAAFAQGREYFAAARSSGVLVRPLLLYYGVLSLSRALVLFLSDNVGTAGLKEAHGLTAQAWRETLTTPADAMRVAFRVDKGGTFFSLVEATGNLESFYVHRRFHLDARVEQCWPTQSLPGQSFALGEVMARTAELAPLYARCTQEAPQCFSASVSVADEGIWLDVDAPDLNALQVAETLSMTAPWRTTTAQPASEPNAQFRAKGFCTDLTAEWERLLPQMERCGDHIVAVAAFANGIRLARMPRLFLLSAFLGTLCRYHPSAWLLAIQGRARGDFLMPLVRAAMDLVDSDFPGLVIECLEGRS